MTQSRSSLISLSDTPYYHCISRCVRRAFLCGEDQYSGKSFSHRRQWMVERIRQLSNIFAINVCAYSILSNHYHLVLHANEVEIEACSDEDICKRWYQLYSGSPIVTRWIKGELATETEVNVALEVITKWRHRLVDISWFMRSLNEFIARKANKEDNCKGRFWEGRFKSQALLDEKALLTCMAYVDLNPVRAKMAKSVESSEYTSIFERIHGIASSDDIDEQDNVIKPLFAFVAGECNEQPQGIPYAFIDYLELVDWTGRVIRDDKRGTISAQIPSLLSTLGLDSETWLELACSFGKNYHGAVGSLDELALFAEHTGKRWISGKAKLQRMLH
ncbi:transposase [Psychromonas antarctica]|uniref:transposase n=1 Tax=Psychromonas antarctica TaxID=67573 RepID=UPI001EE8B3B9|nr:transposase [Psychromonas antarctica]MCG6202659.1 transposase [Psychromonas antarctica]